MVATLINSAAIVVGGLLGLILHRKIGDTLKTVVYTGAGIVVVVLGLQMAFQTTRIVILALALITGGFLGEALNVEGGILAVGNWLKGRLSQASEDGHDFAQGFLDASVIFCVGAMALIGSFKAGVEADYSILLTKSVLDGFVAMIFAAALGVGVIFSAVTVLIYQGSLTLLGRVLEPVVTDLVLSELTGIGGCLLLMIGLNLLGVTKIKTANYLPGVVVVILLLILDGIAPMVGLR
jgi:uncharacterized membrane protein YqgA involved in biofilm formation